MTTTLTSAERKTLKKQKRPSLLLGLLLFFGISIVNLVLYYQDLILGTEGLERPPLAQLIIIEVVAAIIGISTYYFPSKKWIKDLASNEKRTEKNVIKSMFIRNNNGQAEYTLRLVNSLIVITNKTLYSSLKVGDTIEVSYAPTSSFVFSAHKTDLGGSTV